MFSSLLADRVWYIVAFIIACERETVCKSSLNKSKEWILMPSAVWFYYVDRAVAYLRETPFSCLNVCKKLPSRYLYEHLLTFNRHPPYLVRRPRGRRADHYMADRDLDSATGRLVRDPLPVVSVGYCNVVFSSQGRPPSRRSSTSRDQW